MVRGALLATCLLAARARAGDLPFSVRTSCGIIAPALGDVRAALKDERDGLQGSGWTGGGIPASDLDWGPSGGIEVLWRPRGRFAYTACFRGSRIIGKGTFAGTVSAGGQTVTRSAQYEPMGGEVGASWVAAESVAGSWVGPDLRAGLQALVVSRDGASEAGPVRWYHWDRSLSALAPSVLLGASAEWRGPEHPPLFIRAGYRFLKFAKVTGASSNADGVKSTGTVRSGNKDTALDFSGPEVEVGVTWTFSASSEASPAP